MSRRTLAALSAAALLVLTGCGDDDGGGDDSAADQPDNPDGATCEYAEAGEPAKEVDPPATQAAYDGDVPVTIETSAGAIRGDAGRRLRAVHGQLVHLAGQPGLLRRHHLPPADHRRDLRAPVR